jgi:hypothetical protein
MSKQKKAKEESDSGMSLDEAFADDEDVVYSDTPKKPKKKEEKKAKEAEFNSTEKKQIKAGKQIEQIKKGDKIKIDGKEYEVDAHELLIDHKITKEMAIDIFDAKTDKDFQIRYFTGRLDVSDPEFFELVNDFIYQKRNYVRLEW